MERRSGVGAELEITFNYTTYRSINRIDQDIISLVLYNKYNNINIITQPIRSINPDHNTLSDLNQSYHLVLAVKAVSSLFIAS